ncbi:hypothetical protein PoB_000539200 [Plakobranchus ocellatus]|uniref:Uncharacterized protein n=1 Tax=Plakobranchus ocellatus TaxID=259542 RepID=A0AAV3Y7Y1_9GAST|nr:hypothetical protein PoB_000539200 [Plakobranchus ocellatus]
MVELVSSAPGQISHIHSLQDAVAGGPALFSPWPKAKGDGGLQDKVCHVQRGRPSIEHFGISFRGAFPVTSFCAAAAAFGLGRTLASPSFLVTHLLPIFTLAHTQ